MESGSGSGSGNVRRWYVRIGKGKSPQKLFLCPSLRCFSFPPPPPLCWESSPFVGYSPKLHPVYTPDPYFARWVGAWYSLYHHHETSSCMGGILLLLCRALRNWFVPATTLQVSLVDPESPRYQHRCGEFPCFSPEIELRIIFQNSSP
jgi:hypothetical protein